MDGTSNNTPSNLSFVAPCRQLAWSAPLRWLKLGWQDYRNAGKPSAIHGGVLVLLSYLISLAAWQYGTMGLLFGLLTGFVFVGPFLALSLYSLSRQIELGERPSCKHSWRDAKNNLSNELVFATILIIVLLIWARAASMVHIFFPSQGTPELPELALFLSIGTLVGALFSAVIFLASAFSLPMLLDRRTDVVTAVVTSINAVLRNRLPCMIWAMLIVTGVLLGFFTAFLGLAVIIPVIGHATWHAYRETIDANDWPQQ